ncbi:plastocyanin/azurin family copper-binding protein [Natrarchaeobius oligotrophus]|uniref:Halocyanin n=1 Tax=Natrarchaeobius chitinivorans TaxID=1679083 RepID=A0A3N6MRB1_NATCH|nr:plastocyanin/azurin family copper-binding protein [Natrarchaeobius chitinivorans]RQG98801.1 halocyanin [Natrarchaeobius chitinivorans]
MGRRRRSRRELLSAGSTLFAAGSTLLASGFAGCLEESPGADDPQLGDPEPFVEIELTTAPNGERVDPSAVHLVDGGTIEWVGGDGRHDTTAYHPATHGDQRRIPDAAEPWASDVLDDGDSFDRTFDDEGVYDYVCTRHEAVGMVGTIVVGWPDPDDQPALESPSESYPPAAVEELERLNDRVRAFLEDAHR